MNYDYRVRRVLRVVDGDTVDLELDLGFYLSGALRFRLLDVDTPERGQPGWAEATDFVQAWLDQAAAERVQVWAATAKADSFGRWLAVVYRADDAVSLNRRIIESGHGSDYRHK